MNKEKLKRLYVISPEAEEFVKETYDEFWPEIEAEIKRLREADNSPEKTNTEDE